ncbi:MAG: DUF1599 domain-containing protein [Bacteroidetes bacterium]|nr:DUF1599 domain-containing protein [Bacteroidota bacterium]
MQEKTILEYNTELANCRKIFTDKLQDYGTNWRVLRVPSLIDQIFIKAQRIRSIEEKKTSKIDEPVYGEFLGIVNYSIITLIQLEIGSSFNEDIAAEKIIALYNTKATLATELMLAKNHDYGEAWREMYVSSFTDLILSKLLRIRNIIANDGVTIASEGIESNLYDMLNYAMFAMIRLNEKNN